MRQLNFIDLFSGAGGLSEGFINAGFEPIAHVEIDAKACETLETRLIYHKLKSEVLYLMKGKAEVTYGSELSLTAAPDHDLKVDILKEGDTLHVQSGCPYRIKAITDCKIIEVGNNASDSPIRIEDDYGRLIIEG